MPPTSAEIIADPVARYPAATIACFDPTCGELPRRRLDEGRTVAMLEQYASLSVPAVLIASSTGHGHLRTTEELETWFRCAARADCGEMVRIGLLRPEDGIEANRRLLDLLAESAFPVVFLRPGTDLPKDANDAAIAASMEPLVAEAAERGMAVGLYTIPDVSGVSLTAEAAAQLVESEGGGHIVAIKVTEADYESSTARFLAHPALERLKIVQGWDPHLLRALREGRKRVGITSGLMALAVYQYRHLLAAAAEEQWQEAEASQQAATALFTAMQDDPRHFADLQRAKYIMGLGHPLTAVVSDEQVDRVFLALQQLSRDEDRRRLAYSLDLMGDGPFHQRLVSFTEGSG